MTKHQLHISELSDNISIRHISNREVIMEYIILGLLSLKPMTGYEIGLFVKKNLAMICSSSAGSVQTALKKLVANGSITYEEIVENKKNKKIFSITDQGTNDFMGWVKTPMQTEKVKNMELSKLFFLGFATKEQRIAAIQGYIKDLYNVKETLAAIKEAFMTIQAQIPGSITKYQGYTLDYGMDSAEFEINWYSKLLKEMEEEV